MNIYGMRRSVLFSTILPIVLSVGACNPAQDTKPTATPAPSPTASAGPAVSPSSSPVTDSGAVSKPDTLIGRWPGVEGSYLNITKKGDKYSVEIANLDGPKTYEGTAKGDTIEFSRNGKTETIRSATGAETGMKGFEKEANCVVVTKGSEGFCKK